MVVAAVMSHSLPKHDFILLPDLQSPSGQSALQIGQLGYSLPVNRYQA